MTEISMNHGKMAAIVDILLKGVKDMDGALDELEAYVLNLQEDFTGEAASAYNRTQAKWNQAIRDLGRALNENSRFVEEANAAMRQADARGAGGLGG